MARKRRKLENRINIQKTLEENRRFDYDYVPYGKHWFIPDGDFRYRGCLLRRAGTIVVRCITATLGAALIKIVYGAKVTGKNYKKAIGKSGAVCVCNHFSYLDTLFVRQAVGHFRSYHTIAPWNNKTGVGGMIIRMGGTLPLSPNLSAMRNMNREIDRLLQSGKIVNFYAEQAMWINYDKPRPMKEGAFYYAVKNGAPVLPVFCTFHKNQRGHIKKLRIHILPPVYPQKGLPRKESLAQMKSAAEAEWKACYEENYAIPLEYLPAKRKRVKD